MRALVPALFLMLAAFAAGAFLTKTAAPVAPSVAAGAGIFDNEALAAMRKDNQMLRAQIEALASDVAALRTSLQDRPAATVVQANTPAMVDLPDSPANKPARDALDRYRAATGNQKPTNPADLAPFFTDPQLAEKFLKNRVAAVAANPDRLQLKADAKTAAKQRLKAGAPATPAP